jgi:hypothetical protein
MKLLSRRSQFFAVSFIFGCLPIWAASTLQVGSGCTSGCTGDPNFSGQQAGSVDIYDNSNGTNNSYNPTLLIIGVPNVTGQSEFSNSSITSVFNSAAPGTPVTWQYGTEVPSNAAATYYGLSTLGYFGNFTAGTAKDVYSFLGLTANNSQNYTNWSCVDLPAGAPSCSGVANAGHGFVQSLTGFGIYVFALNSAAVGKDYIQVNLQGNNTIPEGSYVIAYSGSLGTAFTNTGLQDVLTPEPVFRNLLVGGMILMGLVLLARKRVADQA